MDCIACCVKRHTYKVFKLRGQHLTVNLVEVIDPDERGYIVATKLLSNEDWKRIQPGQLMIFSQGNSIVISGNE
ncbi:MAG TPA: hypothetical protein ENK36_07875 [Desulfobacterales bacterium]|nr:hypothetical protein [Desulfobacterales bacterium]